MKTSKWYSLTLAAALAAGGVITVPTQAATPDNRAPGARQTHLRQRAHEALGITPEQKQQIRAMLRQEKDTLLPLARQLHEARVALRRAIRAQDATETSVRAAAAQVAALEADLAVERFELFGKLSPMLTAEQHEKLETFQTKIDDFVDAAIDRLGERMAK